MDRNFRGTGRLVQNQNYVREATFTARPTAPLTHFFLVLWFNRVE